MLRSLENINAMLRANGKLVILQPVGGEFEKTMRLFFEEHSDMDEYTDALNLMEAVTKKWFIQIAKDKVISEFVIDDLDLMCNALKMFAITEGANTENALASISLNKVERILEPFKNADGYHLSDEVDVFVFEKRK